jgi:Tfp pilus assembly protein PilF
MLGNVAEVFLAKGKESDAIALFQRILDAHQKKLGENSSPAAEITNRIALAYFNKGDYGKAEVNALKLMAMWEKLAVAESSKKASTYDLLGDIYRLQSKMELAEAAYLNGIAVNDRILSPDGKKNRTDLDNYYCFLYHRGFEENQFAESGAKVTRFRLSRTPKAIGTVTNQVIYSGVVNSKAVQLVKPKYPPQITRARGFVVVQVTIDESGNVIAAKATCGIRDFLSVSEFAAKRSKFTPTLLSGNPVKVTGTIIYNFGNR